MAFNGVFLGAIIVYICAKLSPSIYIGIKKSVHFFWYIRNYYYLCTRKGLHSVILHQTL